MSTEQFNHKLIKLAQIYSNSEKKPEMQDLREKLEQEIDRLFNLATEK